AGGQPHHGRRDHGADRDRRRLPRLQRQPRPAVRAHLPGLGAGAGRGVAGARRRRADGRRARGLRRGHLAGRAPRRRRCGEAGPEARQRGQAAAAGLDLRDPHAVGARAQVPPDREGPLARRLRARLPDRPRPLQARAGRARPGAEHVPGADAAGDPAQPARVRERARRARAGPEPRDRGGEAATRARHAGDAQPRLAEDRARALLPGDRERDVRARAGGRDSGPALRLARRDLQLAGDGREALHPGDDLQDAADPRRRRPRLPGPAPVPAPLGGALRRPPARSRGAAPHGADPRLRARRRRPGPAGLAAAQRAAPAHRPGAARLQQRRRRPQRPAAPGRDRLAARPRAQLHHPGTVGLQLRDAALPQRREREHRRRRPRDLAAVHHLRPAARSEQRGEPLERAGQRRPRQPQLPALEPLPEHRLAGPAARVRGRQRALPGGAPGDRQRARQPGHGDGGAAVSPRLRRQTWVERARRRATWRSGLLVTAIIAVGVYLAFAKQLPWSSPAYQLHAVFTNATTLKQGSPVRIAGVNVGKVLSVEPAGNAAEVTFSVDSEGQPVHADATVEIRPRLFLEGNFFLDLHPGSASAPELPDGGTIPITQTSRAVQLDEILTALQEPARGDLAQVLHGFGNALTHEPTPAEDATQDPSVRGKTAAEAINQSFRYGGRAGRSTAQVSEALLGTRPHDLSELIAATANVSGTLLSREQQLKDLVTSFNRTAGALASVSGKLSETIRRLAPTLEVAQPSLRELSDALPPLRAFAIALRPSLRPLPGTIRAATPWLDQARLLLRRRELGGIARKLA